VSLSFVVVAGCALVVGVAAGFFWIPRFDRLDVARQFQRFVGMGGGRVLYHPLGRYPERKIDQPSTAQLPGGFLEGEAELMKRLAGMGLREDRFGFLYAFRGPPDEDPGLAPGKWLGPAWRDAQPAALAQEAARRLGAQWVHVHDPQGPAPALCETVVPWNVGLQHPEVVALYTAWVADAAKPVEPAFVQLKLALLDLHLRVWAELAEGALGVVLGESLLEQAGQGKLLVVASGRGAWALLRALSFSAALRDRVVASVSVGGVVQGRPGDPGKLGRRAQEDWLGAWFQHELLDVEVVHPVPYLAAELVGPHVNPLGLEGLPVASQRYPEPTYVGGEPTMVEVMDLGLIYASEQTPWEAVGEALRATTGLVALARRV